MVWTAFLFHERVKGWVIFKKLNESYIKNNKSGTQTLVVYYSNRKADYDEMTEIALKRHGLARNTKINILCLPNHGTRPSGKTDKQGFADNEDDK